MRPQVIAAVRLYGAAVPKNGSAAWELSAGSDQTL